MKSIRDIGRNERQRLHVIEGGRQTRHLNSATAMNPGIKDSVIRLVFDSPLRIGSLRKAANLAGTSEGKALDALRNYVYDLRIMATPDGPTPPAAPARKAA